MNENEILVEVLLFASIEPLTQLRLEQVIIDDNTVNLTEVVDSLNNQYKSMGRGLQIIEVAGGYQLNSQPDFHIYIQRLKNNSKKMKLSHAALETLSIIAYKQPINRSEIESIRGVECGGVIKTLMERMLVTVKGRDNGVGRALLYGTTQQFLLSFGLNHIQDLPKMKEIGQLISEVNEPTEVLHAPE